MVFGEFFYTGGEFKRGLRGTTPKIFFIPHQNFLFFTPFSSLKTRSFAYMGEKTAKKKRRKPVFRGLLFLRGGASPKGNLNLRFSPAVFFSFCYCAPYTKVLRIFLKKHSGKKKLNFFSTNLFFLPWLFHEQQNSGPI